MGFYERNVLPRLIHFCCGTKPVMKQREKVVPLAEGRVLEIGVGSGLNLSFYDRENVEKIWGLEPSEDIVKIARKMADGLGLDVEFIGLPGDEIPLEDDSVDTVLMTYTLCTIPETEPALRQMARVLRPGGKLIFCEHGAAPDAGVRKWQDRLNGIWGLIGGGCNLNRDIPNVIEAGGFRIDGMDTMYIPGPRFASFNYWGTASSK